MKTILFIIALTGLTISGGYAQNKSCADRPKTAHKTAPKKAPVPTCFMLKKENLGIPGCVDVYGSDHSYLGYYSKKTPAVPKTTCPKITRTKEAAVTTTYPVPKIVTVPIPVRDEIIQPCYTYRQHNIVVKECPGVFYDDNAPLINNDAGMLEYNSGNTYMGNYPQKDYDVKDPTKMENRQIEGTHFPGDDLFFRDSYKK